MFGNPIVLVKLKASDGSAKVEPRGDEEGMVSRPVPIFSDVESSQGNRQGQPS
ncbi:hypothetical protein M408DRAFT_331589 [Serendipita vermifera MAFF 305830]|uniref:Uncharacterized protein n=1 Tax=Serendipita vermifera MAFF 305830 TaxID=933852 RepID=A0A0C2X639_SERVB|nr:hypothetical protein M408DRAFT_331589 [Serendipita vermifera MAFF 305830]